MCFRVTGEAVRRSHRRRGGGRRSHLEDVAAAAGEGEHARAISRRGLLELAERHQARVDALRLSRAALTVERGAAVGVRQDAKRRLQPLQLRRGTGRLAYFVGMYCEQLGSVSGLDLLGGGAFVDGQDGVPVVDEAGRVGAAGFIVHDARSPLVQRPALSLAPTAEPLQNEPRPSLGPVKSRRSPSRSSTTATVTGEAFAVIFGVVLSTGGKFGVESAADRWPPPPPPRRIRKTATPVDGFWRIRRPRPPPTGAQTFGNHCDRRYSQPGASRGRVTPHSRRRRCCPTR